MDKVFHLNSYSYELPEHLISQYPSKKRDQARLLIVNRQTKKITHDTFDHIDRYLPAKTVFVVNNSKVIPARLLGVKSETGGQVEVFLLKVLKDGHSFEALLKPLKKLQVGQIIDFGKNLKAVLID